MLRNDVETKLQRAKEYLKQRGLEPKVPIGTLVQQAPRVRAGWNAEEGMGLIEKWVARVARP